MPRAKTAPTAAKRPPARKRLEDAVNNVVTSDQPEPESNQITSSGSDDWFSPLSEDGDWLNVLYYGREGATKTTSALMAANTGPGRLLVINAEAGLKKRALAKYGVEINKVVTWPPPGERVSRDGLREVYLRVKADLEQDPTSWTGVVFDSVTEVVALLVAEAQRGRIRDLRRANKPYDPDFVSRDDYGIMTKVMRDVIRAWRDLRCHFIATALERRDVDEDSGKVQYGPAVTPALQTDLLGFVDLVLACKDEDGNNPIRALTYGSGKYRAKDRLGKMLPRVLVLPTFDRVLAYATEQLTEDQDPLQALLRANVVPDDPDDEEDNTEEN